MREQTTTQRVEAFEKQFRRSGLPMFIEGFTAAEDVFTRASPFLVFVLVAQSLTTVNENWPVWANVIVVAGGALALCGGLALMSRWRTGEWSLLPRRVGVPEQLFFVFFPALLPLAAGGQVFEAAMTVIGNAILLLLVYVVVGFGLISTVFGTLRRAADELAVSMVRLVRSLPVLLIFSLVLFINTEMWQVFTAMRGQVLAALAAFFVALAFSLVAFRLPKLFRDLMKRVGDGGGADDSAGSGAGPDGAGDGPGSADTASGAVRGLSRRQRINVQILLGISQATQVLAVCAGMGVLFCALGVLFVNAEVMSEWSLSPKWTVNLNLGGASLVFTNAHLRVALGIAIFTGMYYAVTAMADSEYREAFLDATALELSPIFEARKNYQRLLD